MTRSRTILFAAASCLSIGAGFADERVSETASETSTAVELFNTRIMPIFRSPNPSSCVQCHLASVDLKDYILPSHEQTFLSLKAQGLIDLGQPSSSKILKLIHMGEEDQDKRARLIHKKTRQAEHEAFAAWIDACCKDPDLRNAELPESVAVGRPENRIRSFDMGERAGWWSRLSATSGRSGCVAFPATRHTKSTRTIHNTKNRLNDTAISSNNTANG